ncbi:MAG TPA: T9SS type A sorting domain-containing protein, partial [Flavitalea sp.]|nr:T9SS type A sorting domain-containing protein [Flavitalea sp.]
FNSNGKKDDLYSPLVQIAAVDSVYIKFDVAHVTARFPGSTGIPLDTLEVLLTTDCGKTFKSVYKKWGAELQTVGDPNFPYTYPATDTVGFVPTAKSQFRTDFIDISKFVPVNSNFQVVFRNTSSRGNNTYIDNINISTVTLPARLKKNGFMISPNPFDGVFNVQHLLAPANLKGIQVSNAAGQVVFSRVYNGNATNNMRIDLSRYASGVYHIKLLYDNKVITERIIKKK